MQYRPLGTTDLLVSPLGVGTVQLGMAYGIGLPDPPSDVECIRLLRHALEAGINYFDTAPAYGRSEEIVGLAFAGVTPKPIIATKLTLVRPNDGAPLGGTDLRRQVEQSVRLSLEKLGLEIIDLLQIHNAEAPLVVPELLETMDDLSSRGLVRYWGATTYGESHSLDILSTPDHFRTLQVAYSLLDQRLEKRVFPRCQELGVGLVIRSAFLKGVLSHRAQDLPPSLSELRQEAMNAGNIARAAGMDLPALALRFAAFCPYAHTTLFGTTSIAETKANLATIDKGPLPPEVVAQLNSLRVDDEQLLGPVYETPGWPAS